MGSKATGRLLASAMLLAFGVQAAPAEDQKDPLVVGGTISARNPAGPPELAQFDFLAGDWDVTVTMPQAGGQPFVYQAKWHNHWVANGYVMMQEFRDPYATGIELRSFNPVTRKWDGRNLYVPAPGTWYDNQAELVGGDMVVTSHQQAPDGTALISREIYHAVAADRFEIRTEMSLDQGATWKPGRYSIVAIRVQENAPPPSPGHQP